ncbi:MAG TPA: hypothetical protein VGL94_08420 [Ktedonobacteraceae bacterium]|jgi:hypothetical protein
MMERIQELSPGQIDKLKQIGRDTLTAISPPVAAMVYGNNQDQLQALRNIGPDALGAMSPKIANYLYGPDLADGGQGVGRDDVLNPDNAEKKLGRFPDQIIPPPFTPDPGEDVSWNVSPSKNNCQTCLTNAEDAPRPYGTPFSSGDTEPPIHDGCGCFLTSGIRGYCPIHGYSRYDNRIFELSSRY